jgi:hypothetical protein
MSPEEMQREQSALDKISRGLSDHVVEIFPHNLARSLALSTSQLLNGNGHNHMSNGEHPAHVAAESVQQQDILLTLVPGDKSKRSIRIYPPSRPTSKSGHSIRSRDSAGNGMNGGSTRRKTGESSVLVKLDVHLPR